MRVSLTQQLTLHRPRIWSQEQERKWKDDPTVDNPRLSFQFGKWDRYDGSERLGVLQQRCGEKWPLPPEQDQALRAVHDRLTRTRVVALRSV